jgi:hypothetical protein
MGRGNVVFNPCLGVGLCGIGIYLDLLCAEVTCSLCPVRWAEKGTNEVHSVRTGVCPSGVG